jgi:hypothetical protein
MRRVFQSSCARGINYHLPPPDPAGFPASQQLHGISYVRSAGLRIRY